MLVSSSVQKIFRTTVSLLAVGGILSVNLMAASTANIARNALPNGTLPGRALTVSNLIDGLINPDALAAQPYVPSAEPEVSYPVAFGTVASLKDAQLYPYHSRFEQTENELAVLPKAFVGSQKVQPDGSVQEAPGALDAMGAPIANFDGLTIAESGGFLPPDTQGDIGYDAGSNKRYYFQWVNVFYKVWDVTNPVSPVVVIPATPGNTLWANAFPGSQCAVDNDGDPITLFDEQAGRWMISQFSLNNLSGPFLQCIAVSQTADPTGAWNVYAYQYSTTLLNDYPHFGVWPDPTYNAYYMTVHDFQAPSFNYAGQAMVAFERAKMLTGDPSPAMVRFSLASIGINFGGMLPADLDGLPPTPGTPGFFFEVDDDTAGFGPDAMRVWEFKPNWTTPASSTFGINLQPNYTLTVASFNLLPCTTAGQRTCIPQAGTAQRLDAIGDRLMYRAAFRQIGGQQSVVLNHTVWADGTDRAGVRWYEARRDEGTGAWNVHQQGTYAPTDGLYRWMGSIAMDASGNIALGYSTSSGTTFPAIRYAGRTATDPLNTLPQTEMTITVSTGSQTSTSSRWGDYSMMGVDPQDQCTFWYTQEYHGATAGSAWRTRVASFKFSECALAPDFYITPAPTTQDICQGTDALYDVTVGSAGGFNSAVTMSATGNPGTAVFTPNPVTPPMDGVTTTLLTLSGATAGNYNFTIAGTSGITVHTQTVGLNVFGGIAPTPTLLGPADGATDVSVTPTLSWTASAGATNYYLEIATDAGFSNVVYSTTVAGTTHVPAQLASNTTFYWRVRAANVCGASAFATPFSFATMNLIFTTVCANPNQVIADNTTATTTLNIPTTGTLLDVDVIITATHTWVGDTIFTVTKGSALATIIDRPGTTGSGFGCSADHIGVRLDDEGVSGPVENQCSTTPPALFGNPTPNTPLSALDGESLSGIWSLAVRDSVGGDTGVLQSWCVVATTAGASGPAPEIMLEKTVGTDPAVCAATDSIAVGYGDNVTYCYKVTNTGNISLDTHSLLDNQLGTVLSNFSYVLQPLASAFVTVTTPLTATTVNSATWTATMMTYTASASDMATVTVVVTPTIAVSPNPMSYTQAVNTSMSHTLSIYNNGLGSTLTWNITEAAGNLPTANAVAAPGSTAADRAHDAGTATTTAPRNAGFPLFFPPINSLNEGFDNIGTLSAAGWFTQNNSAPIGTVGWFQGNAAVFPAQGGATTAYIGANFNNTAGTGTISNWLLTPELNLVNGATFKFYTRKTTSDTFPDRLQVRLSSSGASTNVGTAATDVGDFTTLLLDINPTLTTGVYPTAWTEFTVTIAGLSGPTTGRLAFRYFVTNGGPNGANSDYIGIDTVSYALPPSACFSPINIPWLSVSPASGSTMYGMTSTVDVGFNTTGLTMGNTYTATLCVNNNANGLVEVPVTLMVPAEDVAQISLEKTVGTNPAVCATTNNISIGYGDEVTYCYEVTNTGNVTLTTHGLVDDQLGTLLSNFNYPLAPAASVFVTYTTALTATTTNSATWTATAISLTASASDMAVVTVLVTPTIATSPVPASSQGVNTTVTRTLTISNDGPGSTLTWDISEAASAACVATNIPWLAAAPLSGTTPYSTSSSVAVTFDSTGAQPGMTYTATLCVNNNASGVVVIPVTMTIPAVYGVAVTPNATAQTAHPGQTVTYTFMVTNTGNVTDTFDMGVSNSPVFTATTPATVGPLAPGASSMVYVTVQIPWGATDGQSSAANIFITSQGSASATFNGTLTTTAAWYRIYGALIKR